MNVKGKNEHATNSNKDTQHNRQVDLRLTWIYRHAFLLMGPRSQWTEKARCIDTDALSACTPETTSQDHTIRNAMLGLVPVCGHVHHNQSSQLLHDGIRVTTGAETLRSHAMPFSDAENHRSCDVTSKHCNLRFRSENSCNAALWWRITGHCNADVGNSDHNKFQGHNCQRRTSSQTSRKS